MVRSKCKGKCSIWASFFDYEHVYTWTVKFKGHLRLFKGTGYILKEDNYIRNDFGSLLIRHARKRKNWLYVDHFNAYFN